MTLWDSIQREIDEANRRAIEIINPSEQEITKILGGNFLRVFEKVVG